jgi:DNA-binding NarL/FixJ family response regulator
MNGYEVAKRIKGIIPETKIIIMTVLEFKENMCKILRSIKIDGYALKPGSLEKFVNTTESISLTSSIG